MGTDLSPVEAALCVRVMWLSQWWGWPVGSSVVFVSQFCV